MLASLLRTAVVAALALGCAPAPRAAGPAPYVFSWPFLDAPLEPRGGTTRGEEVTLATQPPDAWRRLQTPDLDAAERDRAAILALAGDYRASFDFLETVLFEPGAAPARPYRSWGTERIRVLEARDDFVSLQHILAMVVVDDEGRSHGPFVQKHWRQDWQYEPARLLAYAGDGRFALRPVPDAEQRGAWSQTVYQVDDSPRYGSVGRWTHDAEASTWTSGEAWRPLPRRESSVRDDYDVLAGRHRLTVLPLGWVHEQDNAKLVTAGEGARPLAREIGVDRYERIVDFDFSAADAYWEATAPFWEHVRRGWQRRLATGDTVRLAAECEGEPAFAPFFRAAGRLEEGEALSSEAQREEAERLLDCVASVD